MHSRDMNRIEPKTASMNDSYPKTMKNVIHVTDKLIRHEQRW